MKWDILQLPWLPPPADDFRAACKAAAQLQTRAGDKFSYLAGHCLKTDQLTSLSRSLRSASQAGVDLRPLVPFRLAVLGNATTSLYVSTFEASGARHGLNLEIVEADYDQVIQEALNPESKVNSSCPDAVLVALDHHAIPLHEDVLGDRKAADLAVDNALQHLTMIRDGLRKGCGAPVIFQTIPHKPASALGNFGGQIFGSHRSMLAQLNDRIKELARANSDYVLDVATLAENVGLDRWHDPVQWNLYKLPFSQSVVPLYSDHVGRQLAAIRGRARKCLVLDLDNTVWGGVIGDDGLGGIELGQGSGTGEAFLEIQRTALSLRQRGIVLAVCSKNEKCIALEPFESHPEMILKKDHIASFHANWQDKATNLESIAKELNLGLDALVLLDDNPFERSQVRNSLPMVAVPELPDDPAFFPRALLSAGYFETVGYTREDAVRADLYQANARRSAMLSEGRDLSDYLHSLGMEIQFDAFDSISRSRIVQLINKTNQFNLTTRRYTESDIVQIEEAVSDYSTLQVRVKDCFGDHGTVSVVICKIADSVWTIDTWLMSCRVLGRRVEYAVLNELVQRARSQGVSEFIGEYLATEKNGLVKHLFDSFGFKEVSCGSSGTSSVWRLLLEQYVPFRTPFVNLKGCFDGD
jgi:FkbH-like protein